MRAVSLFCVIALSCAAEGCADRRPKPEDTLNAFLADLQYGRAEAAWAALSESSRQKLLERHRRLAEATGKPVEETPSQILFGDLGIVVLTAPESVFVSSPLGDEVKIQVTVAGGKSHEITMVREGTAWKVDLMHSLDDAPDLMEHLGQGTASTSTSTPSVNNE